MARPRKQHPVKPRPLEVTPALKSAGADRRERWRRDYRTFARECLYVVNREDPNGGVIPFVFSQSQESLYKLNQEIEEWNRARAQKLVSEGMRDVEKEYTRKKVYLKARKVMASTYTQGEFFHMCEFNPHFHVATTAHNKTSAEFIARMSETFSTNWIPAEPLDRQAVDSLNEGVTWNPGHGSTMSVWSAGSKQGLGGAAAGLTFHGEHFSEFAKYPEPNTEVANTMNAAVAGAKVVIESTAQGDNGFKRAFDRAITIEEAWKRLNNNEPMPTNWNQYFRWFWPWYADEHYRRQLLRVEREELEKWLTPEERELMADYRLDLEQIAWRRMKIRGECSEQTNMPPVQYFKQEYPTNAEEAFQAKGNNAFEKDQLKLMVVVADAVEREFSKETRFELGDRLVPFKAGRLRRVDARNFDVEPTNDLEFAEIILWEEPNPDSAYCQGVDAAQGLEDGDWSVCKGLVRQEGGLYHREAFHYRGKADPHMLSDIACWLGWLYNEAFTTVERTGTHGGATAMRMIDLGYTSLYMHKPLELFTDKENPLSFTVGFDTRDKSKASLVAETYRRLREGNLLLLHKHTIGEMLAYTNIDGKYSGTPDDCVMGVMLAIFGADGPQKQGPGVHEVVNRGKKTMEEALAKMEKMGHEEAMNYYWKTRMAVARMEAKRNVMLKASELLVPISRLGLND